MVTMMTQLIAASSSMAIKTLIPQVLFTNHQPPIYFETLLLSIPNCTSRKNGQPPTNRTDTELQPLICAATHSVHFMPKPTVKSKLTTFPQLSLLHKQLMNNCCPTSDALVHNVVLRAANRNAPAGPIMTWNPLLSKLAQCWNILTTKQVRLIDLMNSTTSGFLKR